MQGGVKHKVIVSLTSFPGAIEYASGAVKSILKGSVLPDLVVLYVSFSQFEGKPLPSELLELERENPMFEIRGYEPDIRSYRKLIPAIDDFPDDIIVTIDDDVAYHRNLLKKLLEVHTIFPEDIIAHRAKMIAQDRPYKKWRKYRWYHFLSHRYHKTSLTMQTGVGGVLYPPRSLRKDMLDRQLFTKTAPTTDDIWFWAAAVANGRRVIPVPFGYNKPKSLGKPGDFSLKRFNFKGGTDRNKANFDAILREYPEVKKALKNE